MVVENLRNMYIWVRTLCWVLSFYPSRVIICHLHPAWYPRSWAPWTALRGLHCHVAFGWREGSASKVGEREDGEVMACFPLTPTLPRLQFVTDSVSALFLYQYEQVPWGILSPVPVGSGEPWYLLLFGLFRPCCGTNILLLLAPRLFYVVPHPPPHFQKYFLQHTLFHNLFWMSCVSSWNLN